MLVLTRRTGEEIVINEAIYVTVVAIRGNRVRLGITAPPNTRVDRREIHESRVAERTSSTDQGRYSGVHLPPV